MSDLFSRMIARASGNAASVRSTALPRLPLSQLAESEPLAPATDVESPHAATHTAATPAATHRAIVRSAQPVSVEHRVNSATAAVPTADTAPLARAPSLAEPPHPSVPSPRRDAIEPARTPPLRRDPERAAAGVVVVEHTASPLLSTTPPAVPLIAKLLGTEPVDGLAPGTPAIASSAAIATASHAEDSVIATTPAPPERLSRAASPLPRVDLQQALGLVGRALSQPPRPRPAAVAAASAPSAASTAADEVHITIGHIDVRPATPPTPTAKPARREPSISLADYLRRTPGSAR
jgi:hypothetical protein